MQKLQSLIHNNIVASKQKTMQEQTALFLYIGAKIATKNETNNTHRKDLIK